MTDTWIKMYNNFHSWMKITVHFNPNVTEILWFSEALRLETQFPENPVWCFENFIWGPNGHPHTWQIKMNKYWCISKEAPSQLCLDPSHSKLFLMFQLTISFYCFRQWLDVVSFLLYHGITRLVHSTFMPWCLFYWHAMRLAKPAPRFQNNFKRNGMEINKLQMETITLQSKVKLNLFTDILGHP